MATTQFDSKNFNPQAFKYLTERVPNLRFNELLKSKAITTNSKLNEIFTSQNGTSYAVVNMKGLIDGDPLNYDGETNITATSTKTYQQGVVVVGRAKSWVEADFSEDITGGVDFMANIAAQVAQYKDEIDQDTLVSVLTGVFNMTGVEKNEEFISTHTTTIDGNMEATSLNNAMQKACGSNKKKFSIIVMHSQVSTNLENLQLITFLTQTDANGLTRDIGLGTWSGRLVVIDDYVPNDFEYVLSTDTSASSNKTYYSLTDGKYTVVASATTPATNGYYERTGDMLYTSYILGDGSITFNNVGAKTEYEMDRDPSSRGGEEYLYMRQRKIFSPYGISYEKTNQATNSPSNEELEDGSNWSLVHTGQSTLSEREYINHKAIPIARIISKG